MTQNQSAVNTLDLNEKKDVHYKARMIITLGFLISMGALHIDPIASSLPAMAPELGGTANSTANVVSGFFFGMMFGFLIIGPVSDIIGRKRAIICGLCVLMIGATICYFANSVSMLILGRVIQGLGGSTVMCTGRAIGGDAGSGKSSARTLSFMQIIAGCTPLIMPTSGNAVSQAFGWRAVFIQMIIMDLILLIATIFLVKETSQTSGKGAWSKLGNDLKAFVAQPVFILYTLAFAFGLTSFYIYIGAASFTLQNELGMSPTAYSILFACLGSTMVVGGLLATMLTKRFNTKKVFMCTIGLQLIDAIIIVLLFITGVANIVNIATCFAIIAGSTSIVIPVGLSIAMNESGRIKGSASALCGATQYLLSGCCTSFLSTVKETGSIGLAIGLAMCLMAVCSLLFCIGGNVFVRRRDSKQQSAQA